MKLKRYVLLDNNRVVDLKVEPDHKIDRIAYIGKPLLIGDEYFGKITATSDDVTDLLVKDKDYVMINGRLYLFEEFGGLSKENVYCYDYVFKRSEIQAIYKKIDKDYICVWEKEISK